MTTSLDNLQLARSEKGPMSSRNLSYTVRKGNQKIELRDAVRNAIHNNATAYLSPAITNLTYKGILKTSKEIKKWFAGSSDRKRDFQTTSIMMERAGTGGAMFRNFFRDFLTECVEELQLDDLAEPRDCFCDIATGWKRVAELFFDAGETGDARLIDEAAELLAQLSEQERGAMSQLARLKDDQS